MVKMFKYIALCIFVISFIPIGFFLWFELTFDVTQMPKNYGNVDSQLFESNGEKQPLIVYFGGSEGGNGMASKRAEQEVKVYTNNGYALLAIGYFGMKGLPSQLDRISLNAIYDEIERVAQKSNIDANCIMVAGGSKGAELALTIASKFPTIKGAISLAGSHVVFAGTSPFTDGNASSFMLNDQQVPFVPFTKAILPSLLSGDLRQAYELMLENTEIVHNAVIHVENINGPVLLTSGEKDQIWPSEEMSDEVIKRLKSHNFPHAFKHIRVPNGDHFQPQNDYHHDIVEFLDSHFVPYCKGYKTQVVLYE
ncbi:acyl-CoA thioester hydrolase/BAAT C-terminal domain-containing protein [Pseudoalteromonas sp. G4]|uniref:acyl-CoA thioester hydrolase/BAAT C-terminal domain-containing protein n=1 Tax=Pseudoalteromonas sp. G4 TaxID=2992761 RepID=UPI00237DACFC|nr:acyl-CoA thioester hydrolase/BAAT C-terminal domain-containing protein [Pseudoalteromonas sp. G4]MDE3273326.1 hypothetical protein [Pseudoalteromonas sp. G4]